MSNNTQKAVRIPRTATSSQVRNIGALYTDYVIDYRKKNGNVDGCLTLQQFSSMYRGGMFKG